MTWNIWHGGIHGEKSENFKEDSLNTNNTVEVIIQSDPDILLMQETYCCGMEIAKKAGFKYSWRGSSNLSIHSKFPILDTINVFKPFNSHGVKIKYHDEEIFVFNIWLHYLPDYFNNSKLKTAEELIADEAETRLTEIKMILSDIDIITSNEKLPIIIGGDFNSGSHLDWIESTKELHNNKVVEWPVSKFMLENNYIDTFREVNPNPLEHPGVTWGGFLFDNVISDRIDYIYYKGSNIEANSSTVISENRLSGFFNSDHRAVVSIFKID
jgi:exonuclease III